MACSFHSMSNHTRDISVLGSCSPYQNDKRKQFKDKFVDNFFVPIGLLIRFQVLREKYNKWTNTKLIATCLNESTKSHLHNKCRSRGVHIVRYIKIILPSWIERTISSRMCAIVPLLYRKWKRRKMSATASMNDEKLICISFYAIPNTADRYAYSLIQIDRLNLALATRSDN